MSFIRNGVLQCIFFFILAFLLYANTIGHGFVLDDEVVISRNAFVQKGAQAIPDIFSHDSFAGFERLGTDTDLLTGGRYRPLSLAVFAMIVSLNGNEPLLFHLMNVLLFAISSVLFYVLLLRMLQGRLHREWIAWVGAAIFIAHPVHTEVVANVKGSDELLAFLFGMGSLWMLLKAFDSGKNLWLLLSSVSFMLACLSKEHVLMLIPIASLMLVFFRKVKFQRAFIYSLPLVASGILFLLIRMVVIGGFEEGSGVNDPLNNPFLAWNGQMWESAPFIDRIATVFDNLLRYVKLLFIPYPLTHDYYPFHLTVRDFSDPSAWLGLLVIGAMVYYAVKNFTKREIAAFGVLFFLLTILITSNLFFPVGVFMAERFLFLPSAGFALVAGALSARNMKQHSSFIAGGMVILLLGLSVLTVLRNQAWKDNETLFRADIPTSAKSVKLRYSLGTALLTKALQEPDPSTRKNQLDEAVHHLQFAVEHHPTYYDAFLALGAASYYTGRYEESVKAYRTAFNLFPADPNSRIGLMYALQGEGLDVGNRGEVEKAITLLQEAWELIPDTTAAINLAKFYDQTGRKELADAWKVKADSLRMKMK